MTKSSRFHLWPSVFAVLLVLTLGGTALGSDHRANTPLTASGTAAATVGTAAVTPDAARPRL
ncbi:hypothetical protein GCM10010320_68450 [Streptomyces caelestis]|uniref:Uncharacterized protein n=1 Tax=Streptomyces caelestis TaxID=36816 RepID=A0A7W9HDN5_9ACTN|nr:hypothetical protein [Streptomyces caelestis]GGW76635.1 hypothetical protein GCM10010320_68450 [Streptomyces caelestis]